MKKILTIALLALIFGFINNPFKNVFAQEEDPAAMLTPQETIPPAAESTAEPAATPTDAPPANTATEPIATTTPNAEATTPEQQPATEQAPAATPEKTSERKAVDLAKTAENNINNVQKSKENVWKLGSIMFSEKDMGLITAGIRSHQENVPLEILVPSLFEKSKEEIAREEAPKEEAQQPTPPAAGSPNGTATETAVIPAVDTKTYYLRSIMYFSPENWTIWLNDKKISSSDTSDDPNFQFAKVNNDSIIILWQNANPDTLASDWKSSFNDSGNGLWVSKNSNIVVDSNSGSISLILKPNQSFISSKMAVLEGPPAAVSDTKDAAAKTATATPTQAAPTAPAAATETAKPTGSLETELNSPHMKQYMNQVNMLQSVLGGGKVPTATDTTK